MPPVLPRVDYFDGRSARAVRVALRIEDGMLCIAGEGLEFVVPVTRVSWPERRSSGTRLAHLADGGSLHCADSAAWDAWVRDSGLAESVVVRAQQSWQATLAAAALLLAVCAAIYAWGVPVAARAAIRLVPAEVDARVGEALLDTLRDQEIVVPSSIEWEQQERIRIAFAKAVERTWPRGDQPAPGLRFYESVLGANALALPGGTIIVTDDMVRLLDDREDVLLGVLGHELGHVRERHAMRAIAQVSLLGVLTGLAYGDYSVVLAGVPAVLGQMAYSRDFERRADDESIRLLRANGIRPSVMVTLFDRLRQESGRRARQARRLDLGIALASHPADEERIRRFRER